MRSSQALHEQITDAISRGRLCLAEGCGLTRAELDALCELGAEKLELGLVDEAVTVLRGLVALYPFSAKYYECLGIALLRAGQAQSAAIALKLASTLCPNDLTIRITLLEALLKAGLFEQARQSCSEIPGDPQLPGASLHRLSIIKACLDDVSAQALPPQAVSAPRPATKRTFKLPNGEPLPLKNSQYEVTQPYITASEIESAPPPTTLMTFDESVTITAIVRRRRPSTSGATKSSDVTQTAVVVRRNICSAQNSSGENTVLSYLPEIEPES